MRRSTGYAVATLGLAAVVATACGFDISTQEAQRSVPVATYQAPGVDFTSYRTFAIVKSVGEVVDATAGTPSVTAPDVLTLVTASLQARGFQEAAQVDPTQPPATPIAADLAVNVTALESTRTDPPYWTALSGYSTPAAWGYTGYDWRYPWQWYPIAFRSGTLLVEIADLKNAPPPGSSSQIDVVWASVSYGVASNADYETSRVSESITRAFDQSPYLQTR